MGSYTFKWEGPADEVIITGLFDDWAKSIKMDKKDGYFEKTVQIAQEHIDKNKVYYKFVVDGDWVAKTSARGEYLGSNYDNFLLAEEIDTSSSKAAISSAAPTSSTAQMAGEIPKEPKLQEEKDLPGAFPETPGATPAAENKTFSVDPIPASEGAGNPIQLAAGEPVPDASTLTKNTVSSTVEDDASLKKDDPSSTFSIAPVPATSGLGNPISLTPGEKVPDSSSITSNTISSTVKDDKSLKKDEESSTFSVAPIPATSGLGNPITLAPGEKVPHPSTLTSNTISSTVEDDVTLKKDIAGEGEQAFSVSPIPATSGNGSLGNPIHLAPGEKVPHPSTLTSNTIQSTVSDDNKADALTEEKKTTSNGALFGVPPVTSTLIPESSLPLGGDGAKDTEVDGGPTIQSAAPLSSTAALAGQVPKEPHAERSTESNAPTIQSAAPESTTAGLAGQVPKESRTDATDSAAPTIQSAAPTSTTAALAGSVPKVSDEVPAIVAESQKVAKVEPEASASAEAVAEKTAVETELLKEVKREPAIAEPGQTPEPAKATESTPAAIAPAVIPDPVKESIAAADASPEAATNQAAVADKTAVEEELKKTIPKEHATGESAPTATAATSATAPTATSTTGTTGTADKTGTLSAPATVAVATGVVAPAAVSKTIPEPATPAKPSAVDSRDVSPMSKTPTAGHPKAGQQSEPTVTTGVTTTTALKVSEATSSTPKKSEATPSTPKKTVATASTPKKQTDGGESTAGDSSARKKKNRMSGIFGKLKDEVKEIFHKK